MAIFKDDLGREVIIDDIPKRIISLVPSQTELLYHLHLNAEVVGITKFCVHPTEWFRSKTRIGGTKNVDISKIKNLQPDLIIANKEENVKSQVEEQAMDFPVWISDVNNLEEALRMIQAIGDMTGKKEKATQIAENIQKGFETFLPATPFPSVVYLIWQEPYMTVGGDTFINAMLQQAGYHNLFQHAQRYPTLTKKDLQNAQPDYLFLSSEPYPFSEKHVKDFESFLPHTKVVLVDGEMFSWYGSRLQQAPPYFRQLQHQLVPL